MEDFAAQDLRQRRVPDPIMNVQFFLETNVELKDYQTLPYDVIDALRAQCSIDLTGFNLSMRRRGNIPRSCVLMRGT